MAKTTQVNYDDMQNIIKGMKSEQAEIGQYLKQTKNKVESLHNNQWVGQGADKFFNEMEQTVLPAMGRLEQALGQGANVAQQIINIIHNADEGTKSFFSNLG
jgi:WXG100 family type VII secretion target